MHSFDDFPLYTPYSDIKKNKAKFAVVSKSSWQRMKDIKDMKKKNLENQYVSDMKIGEDIRKKHFLVQGNLEGQSTLLRKHKSLIGDPISEVFENKMEQVVYAVSIYISSKFVMFI